MTAPAPTRILLLEDSDLDAELVTEVLRRTGLAHALRRVTARPDFVAACRGAHDLILADYVLPGFDGMDALDIARAECPDTPFVFVSGTLGEDIAVEALKRGATDYVTKHRLDRLPRTVLRALAEARERRERRRVELELRELNESLERRVAERTAALSQANSLLLEQIAERERAEALLRRAQRLEAVGQLTAGVAHDFNNLLTVILGNLVKLEANATEPATRRRLWMGRAAAERGAKLVAQLLAFSRRQHLEPAALDLNAIVRGMADLLQSTTGSTVRVELALADALWPALADPTQLELVILNLVLNARDAMPEGGRILIETANATLPAPQRPEDPPQGDYAAIAVCDQGTGMSEDVLSRAFEPFFTTKGPGKGTGLGLAQLFGFAKQSGGGVRIDTRRGGGTTVRVYLPRTAAQVRPMPHAELGPHAQLEREEDPATILVVDDDSAVREITVGMLRESGHTVLEAPDGAAALGILDAGARVDMLVLDFAMPGMNGVELAREAWRRNPALPVLFVTGYADATALAGIAEDRVLLKPYQGAELTRRVSTVVSGTRKQAVA